MPHKIRPGCCYEHSERAKARYRRYAQSDKGKASKDRYRQRRKARKAAEPS